MVTAIAPAPVRTERILLVEDDEFSSQLIAMYLDKAGFAQISVARDGREALEQARATRFDLILLDLNLPRLNGPEVLRRLKKDDALDETSVLVISSLTNTEATANCMEHGAEDYLPKPFNKQLLESRVLSILNRRRLQADLSAALAAERSSAAAARRLQAAALEAALGRHAAAAACVLVPGQGFTGATFAIRTLADGTMLVLAAEATVAGVAGGLAALSVPAHLDLLLADRPEGGRPAELLELLEDRLSATADQVGGINLGLTLADPAGGTLRRAGAGLPAPLLVRRDGAVESVRAGGPAPIPYAAGDMLALPGAGVNQREIMGGAPHFNLRSSLAGQVGAAPADAAAALTAALSPAAESQGADLALLLLALPKG